MKTKITSTVDSNVFDEEDWDFFSEAAVATDYYDYINTELTASRRLRLRAFKEAAKTGAIAFLVAFVVLVIFVAVTAVSVTYMSRVMGYQNDVSNKTVQAEHTNQLERIAGGKEVDNDVLREVSGTLTTYFDVLRVQSGYDNLDNFVSGGSNFTATEAAYRSSTDVSYDVNDCNARILRQLGSCVTLNKINDLYEKDGVYYCYASLNVPSTTQLSSYYRGYNYDLTKFFRTNDVSTANVAKFVVAVLGNRDFPVVETEWLFTLKYEDGIYKILDDTEITDYCMRISSSSMTAVIGLVKGGAATTNFR